jgi:hypothetical protein
MLFKRTPPPSPAPPQGLVDGLQATFAEPSAVPIAIICVLVSWLLFDLLTRSSKKKARSARDGSARKDATKAREPLSAAAKTMAPQPPPPSPAKSESAFGGNDDTFKALFRGLRADGKVKKGNPIRSPDFVRAIESDPKAMKLMQALMGVGANTSSVGLQAVFQEMGGC